MEQPEPFITFVDEIEINERAKEILQKVKKPVVVIAIAGPYRCGKSYLLNFIASKKKGFPLGSTVQAQTKGIWIWVLPHPYYSDRELILLDTEGFGDAERGDKNKDIRLFTLAILLSSHIIYNSKGSINKEAITNLSLVTQLTDHIKMNSSEEEEETGENFDTQFPDFSWVVRDFTLEMKIDGKLVEPDQYLEKCLEYRKGATKAVYDDNYQLQVIRSNFKKRRCFVFPQPAISSFQLQNIDSIPESELDSTFLKEMNLFCDFILRESKRKTFEEGQAATGNTLLCLAEQFVKAMNEGVVPNIETANEYVSREQNTKALENAAAKYEQQMMSHLSDDPLTAEEIAEIHERYNAETHQQLLDELIFKQASIYEPMFEERVKNIHVLVVKKNKEISENKCRKVLEELQAEMKTVTSDADFLRPGCYEKFKSAKLKVENDFWKVPGKGDQAQAVLCDFIEKMNAESLMLLKTDQQLSQAEKDAEAEQNKANEATQRAEAQRLENVRLQQEKESAEKCHQGNIRQLEDKHKLVTEQIKQKFEDVIEKRMEELERVNKEQMEVQAETLQKEIEELKKQKQKWEEENDKNKFWLTVTEMICQTVKAVAPAVLNMGASNMMGRIHFQ